MGMGEEGRDRDGNGEKGRRRNRKESRSGEVDVFVVEIC